MGKKQSKPKPPPPAPIDVNQNCPFGYEFCAFEGIDAENVCEWTGRTSYGASGSFKYRTAKDAIQCNSGAFGGDPMPGVEKTCCGQKDVKYENEMQKAWLETGGEAGFSDDPVKKSGLNLYE